ncbi:Vacuolar protein-sorting-associated protein 60 [Nakaseomyces bracarensis]|uniref:Vacuolar protein-sorting-associated protein 60 n=1 Tax=Nakaseomyces bracarensis TaxID=273131 RepID=A0ABR4NVF2_9SACH
MNRIFGYGNKKSHDQVLQESSQAMDQAQQGLQHRLSTLDTQIAQINFQLQAIQKKMAAMKSSVGKKPLRAQALKLLNKRKQLEQMRESIDAQSWSMTQAQMTSDNLKNTMVTVNALKSTNKALKAQYGKIDIDKLQDMQDEMMDLIDQGEELQQVLATNFVGNDIEDIDEGELDAELEALAEEDLTAMMDAELDVGNANEIPSYLSGTVPKFIDEETGAEQALESAQ